MGASSAPGVSPSQVWSKACCDESGADGGAGTMSSSGGTSGRSSSPLLYTAYVQRNLQRTFMSTGVDHVNRLHAQRHGAELMEDIPWLSGALPGE